MKLISLLTDSYKINDLDELLDIEGSIRQIVIISGYLDLDIVEELIGYLENNHDGRVLPILKIFTDSSSSFFYSNSEIAQKYKKLSNRISAFCSDESGIYLVRIGRLFHSKCFIIQSNCYQKFIIGSLNFTRKGLNENEELILSCNSKINNRTKISKLSTWIINDYLKRLYLNSEKISPKTITKYKPLFLRHILLEGNVYYELKENDPFRFKLRLPKELTDIEAQEIHPLLDGSIRDSVSVTSLITLNKAQGGLGKKLPNKMGSTLSWKKYCVETCYGFWNPYFFIDEITKVIEKRKYVRRPHYQEIKRIIITDKESIDEKFKTFTKELNKYILENYPKNDWKYYREEKIFTNWEKWYGNLEEKLNNTEYYDRLVSGTTSVTVPDVWGDPVSSREFEESFLESLIYYWSKEYSRETQNRIAQVVSKNLELSDEDKEDIDIETLKDLIEEWIQENKDSELFGDEN